jgi:tRNA A-37 threonylcarbamoyl transferase component Bud32
MINGADITKKFNRLSKQANKATFSHTIKALIPAHCTTPHHDKQMMLSPEYFPSRLALSGGEKVELLTAVRSLPGRRLVCRGAWWGQPVYVKLFFGEKSGRNAHRDASGARAMMAAGIATPRLLLDSEIADGGGRALVFAEVAESMNAEASWRLLAHDPAARFELAKALVKTVAAHHRARLVQRDMYLKNFLVAESGIFTLDGDGIRRHATPVSRRAGLDNLALLLSKFDAEDDEWLPQLLHCYASVLGTELQPAKARAFPAQVMAHRRRVARGYAGYKVFRNCTDVVIERSWNEFKAITRVQDSRELRGLLDNPDTWLCETDSQILKNGNTCTVFAVPLDARKVVVKRYNIKNFRHGMSRAWRPSRAAVSWSNAHRMKMLGIPTAEPLALLEWRWGPLRGQAYFVAEFVDTTDALAFFADPEITLQRKQHAALNIARLLHKLWRLGLVHGDMKASNVLIGAEEQPLLLDLDAMREARCKWILHLGHERDLRRWMENWRNDPVTYKMMRQTLQQAYLNDEWLLKMAIGMEKSENT